MTSPSDSEPPANRGDKRGWGLWIALAVAGLALVVLLGLPGFLAAELSKRGGHISWNGNVDWDSDYSPQSAPATIIRVELIILAPSGLLMKHSQVVRRFYNWQYHAAGGLNLDYID